MKITKELLEEKLSKVVDLFLDELLLEVKGKKIG